MKVGLVGMAGAGKTTLFRTLAGTDVAEQIATVTIEGDERLNWLYDLWQPKKRSPASFTLRDYPAFEAGGGGRIAALKDEVEALLLVVRGFTTDAYHYPKTAADADRDAEELVGQIFLTDLDQIARQVEKLEIAVTKPTPKQEQDKRLLALVKRIRDALENDIPLKAMELSAEEHRMIRGYGLLTGKPWVLLTSLPDEGGAEATLDGPFEGRIALRVKLEADLMELEEDERGLFMEEMGVEELLLPIFLDRLLEGMGMLRFYTAGDKEVHAWELQGGGNAVDAAGCIHSDLARGFIRAEVFHFDDLKAAGDMRALKAAGKVRLEGKDYVVKDGDVIEIRFNV